MHFSKELLSNRLYEYVVSVVVLFLVPKVGYLDKKNDKCRYKAILVEGNRLDDSPTCIVVYFSCVC